MKTLIFIIAILLVNCSSLKDKELIGEYTYKDWVELSSKNYLPLYAFQHDKTKLSKLNELTKFIDVQFVIFATSYCNECVENLPIIVSILESIEHEKKSYIVVGLDDYLSEPSKKYSFYKVEATPSVLLLSNGKMIGNVTYPNVNWLASFIEIIGKYIEETE